MLHGGVKLTLFSRFAAFCEENVLVWSEACPGWCCCQGSWLLEFFMMIAYTKTEVPSQA